MADRGGIKAGSAFVEIYLKDKEFMKNIDSARLKLKQFGASAISLGAKMTGVGLAISTPFALASKTFADFDDGMRSVGARANATTAELEKLTETAKELGRTTSFTASEVATGMMKLAQAGFNPGEINTMTKSILALARATGSELGQAAEIAGDSIRAFGLSSNDINRVADIMTYAVNNSSMSFDDLFESMKYAKVIAKQTGQDIETVTSQLMALANVGLKGEMGGTALRNLQAELLKVEKQLSFQELGVNVKDATTGKLKNLAVILGELKQNMGDRGFTGLEISAKLMDLFGKRAGPAAIKLSELSSESVNLVSDLKNLNGYAQKVSDAMDAGLGGTLRMLTSAVEGLAISVGDALSPALIKLLDITKSVVGSLTSFVKNNQGLIISFAAFGAGLVTVGAAITSVGVAAIGLSGALSALAAAGGTVAALGLAATIAGWGAAAAATFAIFYKLGEALNRIIFDAATKEAIEFGETLDNLNNTFDKFQKIKGKAYKVSDTNTELTAEKDRLKLLKEAEKVSGNKIKSEKELNDVLKQNLIELRKAIDSTREGDEEGIIKKQIASITEKLFALKEIQKSYQNIGIAVDDYMNSALERSISLQKQLSDEVKKYADEKERSYQATQAEEKEQEKFDALLEAAPQKAIEYAQKSLDETLKKIDQIKNAEMQMAGNKEQLDIVKKQLDQEYALRKKHADRIKQAAQASVDAAKSAQEDARRESEKRAEESQQREQVIFENAQKESALKAKEEYKKALEDATTIDGLNTLLSSVESQVLAAAKNLEIEIAEYEKAKESGADAKTLSKEYSDIEKERQRIDTLAARKKEIEDKINEVKIQAAKRENVGTFSSTDFSRMFGAGGADDSIKKIDEKILDEGKRQRRTLEDILKELRDNKGATYN